MRIRALVTMISVVLCLAVPLPATANDRTDTVRDFGSVVAVARPADFPNASLMRADCAFVHRTERADGSAIETQSCELSDEPVMVPAFQGSPPDRAFIDEGGPCLWASDYWFHHDGSEVYADSYRLVVTPSGSVQARATYPAAPLTCP